MTQEYQLTPDAKKHKRIEDFRLSTSALEYYGELITANAKNVVERKQEHEWWEPIQDPDIYSTPYDLLKRIRDSEFQIKNVKRYARYLENILHTNEKKIATLENQIALLQELERVRNNPWQRNKDIAEMHEAIFGTDSDDATDTEKLDGILSDFVDKKQDAIDLVRSIRGR